MMKLRDVLENELGKNNVLSVNALLAKRGGGRPASLRQVLSRVRLRVSVVEMKANATTDNNILNDHDEIYISFAGGSSRTEFANPRVYESREGGNDYTSFHAGQGLHKPLVFSSPEIKEGIILEAGEYAGLVAVILEQDNAQLESILDAVGAALLTASSVFVGTFFPPGGAALGKAAEEQWKKGIAGFLESLGKSKDEVIGAFSFLVFNDGGELKYNWSAEQYTKLLGPPDQSFADFLATGSKASYFLRVATQRL